MPLVLILLVLSINSFSMQSSLAYILLVAVLMPIISPWGTIAYYQVNRTYIAGVLCENPDRPQLKCDGQCYLVKKLKAQQDKQDKETNERVHNTPLAQLFCQINPWSIYNCDYRHERGVETD